VAEKTIAELSSQVLANVEDLKKKKTAMDDLQSKLSIITKDYQDALTTARNSRIALFNMLLVNIPDAEVDGRAGLKVVGL